MEFFGSLSFAQESYAVELSAYMLGIPSSRTSWIITNFKSFVLLKGAYSWGNFLFSKALLKKSFKSGRSRIGCKKLDQ